MILADGCGDYIEVNEKDVDKILKIIERMGPP